MNGLIITTNGYLIAPWHGFKDKRQLSTKKIYIIKDQKGKDYSLDSSSYCAYPKGDVVLLKLETKKRVAPIRIPIKEAEIAEPMPMANKSDEGDP